MKRRTKIVCTMGPSVASKERVGDLISAGMNVARLNCSHGTWEDKNRFVDWIREQSPLIGPVAILADLQGPKFRIGPIPAGNIELTTGTSIRVGLTEDCHLPLLKDIVWDALKSGDRLLLGDGEVEVRLGEDRGESFDAKVVSGGTVRSRQGITVVGKSFEGPCVTEKDQVDVYEAARAGVDFIALSYVRRASDMRELRQLVDRYDPTIKLVAKIETRDAIREIDEIIKCSDVVMVARGDLGLQMDIEDVPAAQKKIISHCNQSGIPVITATQMLESMMHAARPTRAEASDVANAILDGTDAVMLSGETAAGEFPLEAVKVMAKIAEKAEGLLDSVPPVRHRADAVKDSATDAVAQAAMRIAGTIGVRAIVTTSTSGTTPRLVSKYRPRVPILCACWNERAYRHLSVSWGVAAVLCEVPESTDESIAMAVNTFLRHKRLKIGDHVVVTAGVPVGQPGNTNLILVHKV